MCSVPLDKAIVFIVLFTFLLVINVQFFGDFYITCWIGVLFVLLAGFELKSFWVGVLSLAKVWHLLNLSKNVIFIIKPVFYGFKYSFYALIAIFYHKTVKNNTHIN